MAVPQERDFTTHLERAIANPALFLREHDAAVNADKTGYFTDTCDVEFTKRPGDLIDDETQLLQARTKLVGAVQDWHASMDRVARAGRRRVNELHAAERLVRDYETEIEALANVKRRVSEDLEDTRKKLFDIEQNDDAVDTGGEAVRESAARLRELPFADLAFQYRKRDDAEAQYQFLGRVPRSQSDVAIIAERIADFIIAKRREIYSDSYKQNEIVEVPNEKDDGETDVVFALRRRIAQAKNDKAYADQLTGYFRDTEDLGDFQRADAPIDLLRSIQNADDVGMKLKQIAGAFRDILNGWQTLENADRAREDATNAFAFTPPADDPESAALSDADTAKVLVAVRRLVDFYNETHYTDISTGFADDLAGEKVALLMSLREHSQGLDAYIKAMETALTRATTPGLAADEVRRLNLSFEFDLLQRRLRATDAQQSVLLGLVVTLQGKITRLNTQVAVDRAMTDQTIATQRELVEGAIERNTFRIRTLTTKLNTLHGIVIRPRILRVEKDKSVATKIELVTKSGATLKSVQVFQINQEAVSLIYQELKDLAEAYAGYGTLVAQALAGERDDKILRALTYTATGALIPEIIRAYSLISELKRVYDSLEKTADATQTTQNYLDQFKRTRVTELLEVFDTEVIAVDTVPAVFKSLLPTERVADVDASTNLVKAWKDKNGIFAAFNIFFKSAEERARIENGIATPLLNRKYDSPTLNNVLHITGEGVNVNKMNGVGKTTGTLPFASGYGLTISPAQPVDDGEYHFLAEFTDGTLATATIQVEVLSKCVRTHRLFREATSRYGDAVFVHLPHGDELDTIATAIGRSGKDTLDLYRIIRGNPVLHDAYRTENLDTLFERASKNPSISKVARNCAKDARNRVGMFTEIMAFIESRFQRDLVGNVGRPGHHNVDRSLIPVQPEAMFDNPKSQYTAAQIADNNQARGEYLAQVYTALSNLREASRVYCAVWNGRYEGGPDWIKSFDKITTREGYESIVDPLHRAYNTREWGFDFLTMDADDFMDEITSENDVSELRAFLSAVQVEVNAVLDYVEKAEEFLLTNPLYTETELHDYCRLVYAHIHRNTIAGDFPELIGGYYNDRYGAWLKSPESKSFRETMIPPAFGLNAMKFTEFMYKFRVNWKTEVNRIMARYGLSQERIFKETQSTKDPYTHRLMPGVIPQSKGFAFYSDENTVVNAHSIMTLGDSLLGTMGVYTRAMEQAATPASLAAIRSHFGDDVRIWLDKCSVDTPHPTPYLSMAFPYRPPSKLVSGGATVHGVEREGWNHLATGADRILAQGGHGWTLYGFDYDPYGYTTHGAVHHLITETVGLDKTHEGKDEADLLQRPAGHVRTYTSRLNGNMLVGTQLDLVGDGEVAPQRPVLPEIDAIVPASKFRSDRPAVSSAVLDQQTQLLRDLVSDTRKMIEEGSGGTADERQRMVVAVENLIREGKVRQYLASSLVYLQGQANALQGKLVTMERERLQPSDPDFARNITAFREVEDKLSGELTRLQASTRRLAEFEQKMDTLLDALQNNENAITSLRSTITTHEGSLREQMDVSNVLRNELDGVRIEIARMRDEENATDVELEGLRDREADLQLKVDTNKAEMDQLKASLVQFRVDLQRVVDSSKLSESSAEDLWTTVEDLTEMQSDMTSRMSEYDAMLEDRDMDLAAYESRLATMNAQMAQNEQLSRARLADVQRLTDRLAANETEDERAVAELRSKAAETKTALNTMRTEQQHLKQSINTLNKAVTSVTGSTVPTQVDSIVQKSVGSAKEQIVNLITHYEKEAIKRSTDNKSAVTALKTAMEGELSEMQKKRNAMLQSSQETTERVAQLHKLESETHAIVSTFEQSLKAHTTKIDNDRAMTTAFFNDLRNDLLQQMKNELQAVLSVQSTTKAQDTQAVKALEAQLATLIEQQQRDLATKQAAIQTSTTAETQELNNLVLALRSSETQLKTEIASLKNELATKDGQGKLDTFLAVRNSESSLATITADRYTTSLSETLYEDIAKLERDLENASPSGAIESIATFGILARKRYNAMRPLTSKLRSDLADMEDSDAKSKLAAVVKQEDLDLDQFNTRITDRLADTIGNYYAALDKHNVTIADSINAYLRDERLDTIEELLDTDIAIDSDQVEEEVKRFAGSADIFADVAVNATVVPTAGGVDASASLAQLKKNIASIKALIEHMKGVSSGLTVEIQNRKNSVVNGLEHLEDEEKIARLVEKQSLAVVSAINAFKSATERTLQTSDLDSVASADSDAQVLLTSISASSEQLTSTIKDSLELFDRQANANAFEAEEHVRDYASRALKLSVAFQMIVSAMQRELDDKFALSTCYPEEVVLELARHDFDVSGKVAAEPGKFVREAREEVDTLLKVAGDAFEEFSAVQRQIEDLLVEGKIADTVDAGQKEKLKAAFREQTKKSVEDSVASINAEITSDLEKLSAEAIRLDEELAQLRENAVNDGRRGEIYADIAAQSGGVLSDEFIETLDDGTGQVSLEALDQVLDDVNAPEYAPLVQIPSVEDYDAHRREKKKRHDDITLRQGRIEDRVEIIASALKQLSGAAEELNISI